jgi:hypothetical protein
MVLDVTASALGGQLGHGDLLMLRYQADTFSLICAWNQLAHLRRLIWPAGSTRVIFSLQADDTIVGR